MLIITKYHVNYLNDLVVNQMKTILKNAYEFDCPNDVDPLIMDKLFVKWQGFREEMVENIKRVSFVDKHKEIYPFKRL